MREVGGRIDIVNILSHSGLHVESVLELFEFHSSVKGKKFGLVGGLEGLKSLKIIIAIYEFIETGRDILLRFPPKKCKIRIA